MFVSHRNSIEKKKIEGPAVKNVEKQVLIGAEQGWDSHVMRMFTLGTEGCTPRHTHEWPHIVYITDGKGTLFMEGEEYPLSSGSTAYVPGGCLHQFSNGGSEPFIFMCIVPTEGDK